MAASDLLADFIRGPLEAFYAEQGVDLVLEDIGSLPALDRLRSDEIDLAIIASPDGQTVPRDEFTIFPFAYDAAVIAVNESNPIDEISLAFLGGIFGANEEFNFNTWGELGLSGWGNRNIKPLTGVESESIALELFRHSVLGGGAMKPSVAMVQSDEVSGMVEADAASIAVFSRPPQSGQLKVLMLSFGEDAPAFGPSEDNIHYGDYPVRLPFYIAFNARDEAKVNGLVRVLLDDAVATALAENGLFPLPETVRRQFLIDFDLTR